MSYAASSVTPRCLRSSKYRLAKSSRNGDVTGSTSSIPSRSTPIAPARDFNSSALPSRVTSTTPRRIRISAPRSTRSSSPSGRTIRFRSPFARSISSYSNMIGVTRTGRSRAMRRSSSAVSTPESNAPSAVAILRSLSGRISGRTDCTAAAATCTGFGVSITGNGALSSSRRSVSVKG